MRLVHGLERLPAVGELVFVVVPGILHHIALFSKVHPNVLHYLLDCGFEVVVDARNPSCSDFYLHLLVDVLLVKVVPSAAPVLVTDPIPGQHFFQVLFALLPLVLALGKLHVDYVIFIVCHQ